MMQSTRSTVKRLPGASIKLVRLILVFAKVLDDQIMLM